METLVAVLFISTVSILPVYLYSRSRLLTAGTFAIHAAFLIVYRNFLYAHSGVWHDTFYHCQIWFSLIDQWLASGNRIDWNPYLGGGMPMAIFSNYFLWSPLFILSKLFHLVGFKFSQPAFFNLVWLAIFFGFTAGMVLLVQELFRRKYLTFLALFVLLFGGLFACEMAEGLVILSFAVLPYLFFFTLRFYRTGNKWYLLFFSLLYGISLNQYLPTYNFLVLAVIFLSSFILNAKKAFLRLRLIFSTVGPGFAFLCVAVFIATASPAIYSYLEMRDYVSPARGLTVQGVVSLAELRKTVPVNAPLSSYTKLFDTREMNREVISTHRPFYIGMVLPILFIYGLFLRVSRPLALSTLAIFLIGLGFSGPVWPFLVNLPFIKMTRQIFGFSRIATLLVLFVSLYGLKGVLNPRLKPLPKIILVAAGTLVIIFTGKISGIIPMALFSLAVALLICLLLLARKKNRTAIAVMLIALSLVLGADLISYSLRQALSLREATEAHLLPFDYPANWISTCDRYGSWLHYDSVSSGLPFELRPLIRKLIVWSHPDPAYTFMLQKDFAGLIYGAQVPEKPGVNGSTFFLLGRTVIDSADKNDNYPLRLANFPLEFFTGARVSSANRPEENGLSAIDLNPLTYWHVNRSSPKTPAWIELSYPFPVEVRAVRIYPRRDRPEQFWRGDRARLQASSDGNSWLDVCRLPAPQNINGTPVTFNLPSPVKTKHLRLLIEDRNFFSLAEFQVIDPSRLKAIEDARNSGAIRIFPSPDPNTMRMVVEANRDSYLLRLENFHRAWNVFIDGRRGEIRRIHPNFQMVAVPAGTHNISFEYRSVYPLLLALHLFLAVAGWLTFIFYLAWKRS